MPAPQPAQTLAPVAEYRPALQLEHSAWPVTAWNWPGAQAAQAIALDEDTWPAAQLTQAPRADAPVAVE